MQDAYVYKLNVPALEGLLPLQMLVQIGIDKLQKDYENALLGEFGIWIIFVTFSARFQLYGPYYIIKRLGRVGRDFFIIILIL